LRRGLFITLEGIDGTGKSTHHSLLVKYLRALSYTVCATREPGGTTLGEQVRNIVLSARSRYQRKNENRAGKNLAPSALAELVLMYAARAQHLEEVVQPALAKGQVVVSDRFNDASFAYQGYGRRLGVRPVRALDRTICGRTQPDLTILLDLSPRAALRRALRRERRQNSTQGRFEAEGLAFHKRVRAGYLAIAQQEPRRVKIVRADRAVAEVQDEIREIVGTFLARRRNKRKSKGKR
jgi:dTMP kinase